MSEVTASLTISFSGEATGEGSGSLSAEIDSRSGGLNNGTTTFYAGDSPGFIVYKSVNVEIVRLMSSEGSVYDVGSDLIDIEEWLVFANSTSASLSKPPSGGVTISSIKGAGGDLRVDGDSVVSRTPVVAVCKVKYKTKGFLYRVGGASGVCPVVVFIVGEES